MFRPALAVVLAFIATSVVAQVQRNFPQSALRGVLVVGEAPQIALNGQAGRLSPGARIRDASNRIIVPGSVVGGRFLVNYTLDLGGLVQDVWILTPDEASRSPWPTTPAQQQAWRFDPVAQAWSKP